MTKNKKVKPMKKPLVVVTTGGSGGHIFPAEAISGALLAAGCDVVFITDKRGQAFHSLGVPTYRLSSESITGRSVFRKMIAAVKLLFGATQALRLLQKLKPALVIGVGGYASFPAVLAAHLWRIPVMLHEQNALLGKANRVLAAGTRLIVTSFENTKRIPDDVPHMRVGMPARPRILEKEHQPYPATNGDFHLLIFGGSQGARVFSKRLPEVLLKLPERLQQKLVLVQQARVEDIDALKEVYANAPFKSVTIEPFFKNMPELLSESHLVIGRAGAGTITELSIIGRPAILVPLPGAEDHQLENAKQFCDAGAGWLVVESTFDADAVADRLLELMDNPDLLKQAADAAYAQAIPDAPAKIASVALDLIKGMHK